MRQVQRVGRKVEVLKTVCRERCSEKTCEHSGVSVATKISTVDRMLQCTVEQTAHVPVPVVPQRLVVVAAMFSFQEQIIEQLVVVPVLSFHNGSQRCFRSDQDIKRRPNATLYSGAGCTCTRAVRAAVDGTVGGCANVVPFKTGSSDGLLRH